MVVGRLVPGAFHNQFRDLFNVCSNVILRYLAICCFGSVVSKNVLWMYCLPISERRHIEGNKIVFEPTGSKPKILSRFT